MSNMCGQFLIYITKKKSLLQSYKPSVSNFYGKSERISPPHYTTEKVSHRAKSYPSTRPLRKKKNANTAQTMDKTRPRSGAGVGGPMNSCRPTRGSNTALAWRRCCAAQTTAREQRPQLCGALTGELKTGPWAGNKTLELCRNAEHSSTIDTHTTHCHSQSRAATVAELSPGLHETGQCSSVWNRGLLLLTCTQNLSSA